MTVGIIAEDASDVEVLVSIMSKLVDSSSYSTKKFVGHGCGTLRRKCNAWAKNLLRRGCTCLVIIHDLDDNVETELRQELEELLADVQCGNMLVLIPVREIEAWLLTDANALKSVFNMSRLPKLPGDPESLPDPKRTLRDIVRKMTNKQYANTIHNKKIAESIAISKMKKCHSFRPFPKNVVRWGNLAS